MRYLGVAALALAAGCNGGGSAPPVVVNEVMASNTSTLTDESGAYPDWIELYNTSGDDVPLDGLFLSDDLGSPTMAALPADTTLAGHGFVVLFADGDTVDGDDHLPFQLAASGESLLLSYEDSPGHTIEVDSLSFGPQDADVSFARAKDGGDPWQADDTPTPGESNEQ